MTIINERLLSKVAQEFSVDINLPIRLQKRFLLKTMGFPQDPHFCATTVQKTEEVNQLLEKFISLDQAFLILVDEKPMSSHIPPMYFVKSTEDIVYRSHDGFRRQITWHDMKDFVARHSLATWLSFVPVLWNAESIAARLIYQGAGSQILEMQLGTSPAAMMTDHSLPCFVGEIRHLDLERFDYIQTREKLRKLSYVALPFSMVRKVCRQLSLFKEEFEILASIAKLPTLEFAFQKNSGIIVVDVDWPSQWVERRG